MAFSELIYLMLKKTKVNKISTFELYRKLICVANNYALRGSPALVPGTGTFAFST